MGVQRSALCGEWHSKQIDSNRCLLVLRCCKVKVAFFHPLVLLLLCILVSVRSVYQVVFVVVGECWWWTAGAFPGARKVQVGRRIAGSRGGEADVRTTAVPATERHVRVARQAAAWKFECGGEIPAVASVDRGVWLAGSAYLYGSRERPRPALVIASYNAVAPAAL